jgi:FAD dependent oxidoreductase TIGR03364
MWSPTEVCVDPREVVADLPAWLTREHGVEFRFGCAVLGYERPRVTTSDGAWTADRLTVCSGAELQVLYPALLQAQGLFPCKLQMLRSTSYGREWRLGTMLAAGLTLRHYQAFADCPTLPALRLRLDAELPDYGRYGIHVLANQNGLGEVVIGDSHEYGADVEPFDKQHVEDLILHYLRSFVELPDLRIAARWHGVYVKHPTRPYLVERPDEGVTVVTGVGGAGMTLSFGLAERVVNQIHGT